MTTLETLVHISSKHRWLIAFGLLLGLVPDTQLHTFCSVSQYRILKRCCRNCKIGIQSDAISSNHFPTAIHCSSCFLSPMITSLLPFPFYLHLAPPHFFFPPNSSAPLPCYSSPRRIFIIGCKSALVRRCQWEWCQLKIWLTTPVWNAEIQSCTPASCCERFACMLEGCAWHSPSLSPRPVRAWTIHGEISDGR